VNNAGFGDSGAFHEADWTRQRDVVQVNVMALMQLTRLLVPLIKGMWNSGRDGLGFAANPVHQMSKCCQAGLMRSRSARM
jgi:NAD(P)-dependent dehydrogenase (short-subunit alcohol dehydrogenase family)